MLDQKTLKTAYALLRKGQAQVDAYEAEVAAWYRSGDGRPRHMVTGVTADGDVIRWNAGGQGRTFPHCFHGASRWTDYDNICGGCEDGWLPNDRAWCIARAKVIVAEADRRIGVAMSVAGESTLPAEVKRAMVTWALEVFDDLQQ